MADVKSIYAKKVGARNHLDGRPTTYEQLLLEPISDVPGGAESYPDWEFEHGQSLRFYVGGFRWFQRATGTYDLSKITSYAASAIKTVDKETNWRTMPESRSDWAECSLNQFRAARSIKAQHFAKAALVIVACEKFLADMLSSDEPPSGVTINDIYKNMSVVPAVWRINDFDKDFLSGMLKADPSSHDIVAANAKQSKEILEQMSKAATVSSSTVLSVKESVDKIKGIKSGIITAKPVKGKTRNAATEAIEIN